MPFGNGQDPSRRTHSTRQRGVFAAAGAFVAVVVSAVMFSTSSADEADPVDVDPVETTLAAPTTTIEPTTTTVAPEPESGVEFGQPGVVAAVDFSRLESAPTRQWGVVGTGSSYSAAKSQVWDFAEVGDTIYVAGLFTGVQRNADDPSSSVQSQPYLAAFHRDSGEWVSTFRPVFDRAVYSVEVAPDGMLLVGGEFTKVNDVARGGLVKIDPVTGATIETFPTFITSGSQAMVRDIVVDGDTAYLAGQISNIHSPNGAPWVWNVGRINALTGAVDVNFTPRFMGGVWQVAVDHDRERLHAAGFFTSVSGQSGTASFASVTLDTGAYISGLKAYEHNEPNGQRDTVAVVYGDDKIYVGGAQHIISVLDANTNERIGHVTSGFNNCTTFKPCGYKGGGDYQVLEMAAGGTVLAGCHCYADNAIYNSLAKRWTNEKFAHGLSTMTNETTGWVPDLKQRSVGTYAMFVDSNACLYIGGDYVRRGDGGWIGGFGRFCEPNVAPSDLTATSANRGASLSWAAPDSPLPVAYYKVYRNGTFAGDTTGTTYGFSNLTEGAEERFTVRSMDTGGRLSPEASASVTITGRDTEAPNKPGNALATSDAQTVTLSWDTATDRPDPGGVGVSGYLVHRDWAFLRFVPADQLTFTESDVPLGNRRYEIRAVDRNNQFSEPSVVNVFVGVVDEQPPTVPGNAAAAVSGPTGQSVTLTWNASTDLPDPGGVGVSGYLIHRDWNFLRYVPADQLTFTENDVALGSRRYEIRAVDKNNRYSAPASLTVTVGPVDDQGPTTPPNVTATVNGSTVTLGWDASVDLPNPGAVGLSGYLVHRDWAYLAFIPAGTHTYVDQGAPSGNRRYELRAVDLGNRYSAPSPAVIVTVGG